MGEGKKKKQGKVKGDIGEKSVENLTATFRHIVRPPKTKIGKEKY